MEQAGQPWSYTPLHMVLLAFVPVVVVAFFLLQPLHAIRSVLAICLAAIMAFVLYSARYGLRVERWLRQVKPRTRLSATHYQIVAILLAIALGVVTATLNRAWIEEPLTVAQKVILYMLLGLTCVGLAGGLTLTVVLGYGRRLDDRVPQPIFVDMNRLSILTIEAARKQLGVKGLETLAIRRTQNGGVWIRVEEKGASAAQTTESGTELAQKRRSWVIVADRWGRLQSVLPDPKPDY